MGEGWHARVCAPKAFRKLRRSRSVTLRAASKKASPVMAARTVANLVRNSMRPQTHCARTPSMHGLMHGQADF
jgi:hypothetical protein